jgi:cytochrome c oxidase subunit II
MLTAWNSIGVTHALAAMTVTRPKTPNIFAPASTPAFDIHGLALFVLAVCAAIFLVVGGLLAYAVIKFGGREKDRREPVQVYGSTQIELAWTLTPALIALVLFLTAARVIHQVQDAREPAGAIDVTVVGHQFWWEFRYPQYGVVTANELHVPVSDPAGTAPTYLTLLSADTDHSFWVPQLAGKTDLIPNNVNHTWIDPQETGMFVGQCAQYCGVQHAHMLLRVYVQPRAEFDAWIHEQEQAAVQDPAVAAGRQVFETSACIDCHTVQGTIADGKFGPDLTHLMSRQTLGAGVAPNNPENLKLWVKNPDAIKPRCLMPAMNLDPKQLDELVAYLETLR